MTEYDNIAFGTPEAELLGAAAFGGEPLQPPADIKTELMARISPGGSENAHADVIELPRRRTQVRRLAGATAAVFLAAGGFAAGRAWMMHGVSNETKFDVLNQASDYSQALHKIVNGHTIRLVWPYKRRSVALITPTGMQILRGEAVQA